MDSGTAFSRGLCRRWPLFAMIYVELNNVSETKMTE